MKIIKSITRLRLTSLLMFLISINGLSQSDTINIGHKPDTSESSLKESRHTLFTGIGYGNNMIYMGSTISEEQSFGYTALTYGFNNEFFVNVSAVHLSNLNPFLAFYSGSVNYNHVFNTWIDISSALSGYKAASVLTDSIFSNFIFGDVTVGIDWRILYSKISFGGIISDQSTAFFQLRNSRYFQTPKFIKNKAYFSFDPYVNLLFGTLVKVETATGTSTTSSTTFGRMTTGSGSSSYTSYSKYLSIMEIDFGLPVAFNIGRFSIEAEASYVLPTYNDPDFPAPKGFVLLLSACFRIF